jgi:recombinational DNA repair protein (RecF pathway)
MDERTSGIILRTRPLTETSLIVHMELTAGPSAAWPPWPRRARRPSPSSAGNWICSTEAEFSFARSRRSDLHTLAAKSSCETRAASLRENLGWIEQASYFTALVEQTTERKHRCRKFFNSCATGWPSLPKRPRPRHATVFAFEFKLLARAWPGAGHGGNDPQPGREASRASAGRRRLGNDRPG